jgi:hypothetical protein
VQQYCIYKSRKEKFKQGQASGMKTSAYPFFSSLKHKTGISNTSENAAKFG